MIAPDVEIDDGKGNKLQGCQKSGFSGFFRFFFSLSVCLLT